jgi:predicted nucleic acid-binding protein
VLRRYASRGDISAARGAEALADLAALPLNRYPHDVLLTRIWELRENLTAYEGAYVALAEVLGAPLVTRDEGRGTARWSN